MTDEAPALNAEAIIAVLDAHGVDYVVIGAFAARASGAPIPLTLDIDFTPSSSPENLRRIADALRELAHSFGYPAPSRVCRSIPHHSSSSR